MSAQTPRERFVEAIRDIYKATTPDPPGDVAWAYWLRQAVEAFADADCLADHKPWVIGAPTSHAQECDIRASLLHDCGLSE